jgi:predicted dehydrogenase
MIAMQQIVLAGGGCMGAMHAKVYRLLPAASIAAVVDPRGERILKDLCADANVPVFPDLAAALERVECSAVDICLPTDLHRETALLALAAGKHVFCEKPIALTREDAAAMTDAAQSAGLQMMVGHCIRFWPEYLELKRAVDSGEYGRLVSLSMDRRTGRPGYSIGNWVNRPERCLGAALDLHIHDTDFLLHLLGCPEAVVSQGLRDETGWSSISTQYVYAQRIVVAEGAWNYPEKWGFQMRFHAVFERGVLEFDSSAKDTLMLTAGDSSAAAVRLSEPSGMSPAVREQIASLGGYYHELDYFVDCLERGEPVAISTGAQAAESLDLVLAEIESAASGKIITLKKSSS